MAAWLLINSMRMESLQFIQLCIQELHTVWRKRAFHMLTGDSRDNVRDGSEVRLRRFLGDGDEATHLRACIQKFREEVRDVWWVSWWWWFGGLVAKGGGRERAVDVQGV